MAYVQKEKMVHPIQQGTVAKVKADKKGFMLDDNTWWGSNYKVVPEWVQAGMLIEFDYSEKGPFYQGMFRQPTGAAKAAPAAVPAGSGVTWTPKASDDSKYDKKPAHPEDAKRMARCNALAHATACVLHGTEAGEYPDVSLVIRMAREIEEYIAEDEGPAALADIMNMGEPNFG